MRAGILLAFEGIDGAGKTTQAARLADLLQTLGIPTVRTKEPTDGPIGTALRQSAATGRMSAEEELDAFIRDRREHVASRIHPALYRGDVVIVDRYYYSTAAYQGARGFDTAAILATNEEFAPQPDLLFVLDVPVAVGHARIADRGDRANLFEDSNTLDQARIIFRSLSGPHVVHLDGTQPPEQIASEILLRFLDGPVFERRCLKSHYKRQCEPAYCTVRANGCPWVELNSQFAAIGAFPRVTLPTRIAPSDAASSE